MGESITGIFPAPLRSVLERLSGDILSRIEEIRIREKRPLEIVFDGHGAFLARDGSMGTADEAYRPSREDCAKLLDHVTSHSLYSFEEELKRGYITVAGGHRIGLAGRVVMDQGKVKLIRDIAGFNIRIARAITGCAKPLLPLLTDRMAGTLHHTLIISPPQQGKTTLIRDLARLVSSGEGWQRQGRKVGIVDERSEIAACVRGVPHFDVGPRTDVLDGCPKAEGMMMMIRSLSPEILMVDEIGNVEDSSAIQEALNAGIRVVATAHGRSVEEVARRPGLDGVFREGMFARCVVLGKNGSAFRAEVFDGSGNRLSALGAGSPSEAAGVRLSGSALPKGKADA